MHSSETRTSSTTSASRTLQPFRPALRAGLAALVFALLPKCPACLAVYLGALGIGASVATPIAAGLRGAVVIAVIALAIAAAIAAGRRALRHAR